NDDAATDNAVVISGGTLDGDIRGGDGDVSGDATGNTITLSGGQIDANIYGGDSSGSSPPTTTASSCPVHLRSVPPRPLPVATNRATSQVTCWKCVPR